MIMECLVNWILRCLECSVLCLLILLGSTSAQEGFLSIACCADLNYTDIKTSIQWIPDDKWFPGRTSCRDITRHVINHTGHDRARIFLIQSGKRCYNLPTIKGQEYLIRGTFLSDDSLRPSSTFFHVLVGVTPIALVNSSDDLVVEGILRANSEYIDFCLEHDKGEPYISSLELRLVDDLTYPEGESSVVLKLIDRVDLGGSGEEVRYSDDRYDRIWKSPKPDQRAIISISNLINNTNIAVPLKVLKTAVSHTDRLEFLQSVLPTGDHNYSVILYFLELSDSVKTGQRVFDLYINNEKKHEKFDILADGFNYKAVTSYVRANGSLNVTLVKVPNGFEFGPICNAYEVLQMLPWIHQSNQIDVTVIRNVKDELLADNKGNILLESWSGDPCHPSPWEGLVCHSINGFSAVTGLDLSSREFQGPLPPSINQLIHLLELNLSYNDFTGRIPSFPASSKLTLLDLSHNDLTGPLPESLVALPDLEELYYGCNPRLDKELPPSSSSLRIVTDKGICDSQGSTDSAHRIIIGSVACGSILFTVAAGMAFRCFCRRRLAKRTLDRKQQQVTKNLVFSITSTDDILVKSISIEPFSLKYLETATQKYRTLIGEGGFGSVYRGTLTDGQEVAVKVRSATSTQGTREFENELNLLSDIQHENLVPLLGYCCENEQQILVYPFMSNGSLQERLYGEAAKRKTLDWPTRLSIALGAARGLTYLHSFAGRCIIHRDVKSSNILLDHSMCAKVADFGFSKYAPQEGDSGASLEVRGTAGYLDPEYYSTQHLSAKSDVFSFGVVLLEIISGREPLNVERPRNEWSLVEWAKRYIRESKIDEIVDPNIKGGYHGEAMWRVVEVASACIEPFSAHRPSMADIVRELEDALIIENNASEYMKSIDSIGGYSVGGGSNRFGSNRFSFAMDRDKKTIPPPTPSPTEPSPVNMQALAPPEPR